MKHGIRFTFNLNGQGVFLTGVLYVWLPGASRRQPNCVSSRAAGVRVEVRILS